MIVIHLKGGLGNQMFQYALYEKYASTGKEVYLYDAPLRNQDQSKNEAEIQRVFGVQYRRLPDNFDLRKYRKREPITIGDRMSNIAKTLRGRCHYQNGITYQKNYLKWNNCFLDGYWQSPRYFKDRKAELCRKLQFIRVKEDLTSNAANIQLLSEIRGTNSVSIHVRRGDYLLDGNEKIFEDLSVGSYYQDAVRYMEEHQKDLVYFLFSNDMEWCIRHFRFIKNKYFVWGNKGCQAYLDMYLMSQCRHNIIANSSFSWWGAWLNRNAGQTVIAPARWIKTKRKLDIWDAAWVKI